MKEFWNTEITEASWQGLQALRRKMDFLLIGGWAAYIYSRLQKSRDVDIVVDYDALSSLSKEYQLIKNERLRKYEVKMSKYDIDIYVPNYSVLTIPPGDLITKYRTEVEGFSLPTPEALLALKLGAALDRKGSIKGEKDAVDILGLLFYAGLDMARLRAVLSKYRLSHGIDLMISLLNGFDRSALAYLNLNENSFSKLKHSYLPELKKIR
ncbi:MAG: hypothetical protein JRN37_05920 [Nitrososphaerota archaeon]|jgi:hypothetical protein|nr:hypothetical protein [Nitrososphaerota archaeon]MDG7041346.1 hypothetical protein [Nitrososphaerota archaeon]MDG7043703.1 hypothetical protein [Nitrososphaerota archaeon]